MAVLVNAFRNNVNVGVMAFGKMEIEELTFNQKELSAKRR